MAEQPHVVFADFWGMFYALTAQRNETFLTANQGDDKIKKAMEGFKIPAAGEDWPSGADVFICFLPLFFFAVDALPANEYCAYICIYTQYVLNHIMKSL